jgi:hypothetical protein
MLAQNDRGTAVGTKPHTQGVAVPQEQRAALRSRVAGADQRRYVLHIDGISLPPAGGVIIRVFVNLPNATVKTDPDPAHFVGYVTVVPSGPGHRHQVVRNAAFDLTPELLKTVAATDQLSVTLVPVTAGGAEPSQGSVSYKRIYVTSE